MTFKFFPIGKRNISLATKNSLTMTASSISIKKKYDRIVGELESMATNTTLLDQRPEDAMFIDDMLLRLKLWSADIQYDRGSLQWAENLVQVSTPLRERLQQLEQQCQVFHRVQKQLSAEGQDHQSKTLKLCHCNSNKCIINSVGQASEDLAKNSDEVLDNLRDVAKRNLRITVDDLIAFASPIKIAASVPKADRTEETVSRVNQDVKKTFQPRPSKQFPYIMLENPLPADLVELLLGAVIIPEELLDLGVSSKKPPSVRIPRYTAKVRVAQSTMEIVSTGILPLGSDSSSLATSTSPALFGKTAVKVWQLVEAEEYFKFFIKEHRGDVTKLFADEPKSNLVLASVLLTAQLPVEQNSTLRAGTFPDARNESERIFAFGCLKISNSLFGQPKLSREPGSLSRTYHLPPHFELAPPPIGPLSLGSIVTDLSDVESPINLYSELEIPTHQLYRHYTSGSQSTRSRMRTGESGIWARFLSVAGLGDETGPLSKRAQDDTYKFDRLETLSFNPTQEYIRKSVEQHEVLAYINASGYKPVYLVTGLKIARGPAVIQARKTPIGREAQIEVTLPSSIGTMTSQLNVLSGETAVDDSSDFIVGIRFKKIMYRRQFVGAKRKVVEEDFNKGAALF